MNKIFDLIKKGYAFEWGLVAIAFCLPIYRILSTVLIVITALFWLMKSDLKSRVISAFRNRFFLLLVTFYLLHVISYFMSYDKKVAYTDLETKLSLIVLPLFFFAGGVINQNVVKRIARVFVLGCLTAILVCIYFAIKNSFHNPYVENEFNISIFLDSINLPWWELILKSYSYFNYALYSHFMHPSYFALYLTLAAFIVSSSSLWFNYDGLKIKIVKIIIVLFIILNIFLLQSRAGLIALLIYLIWILVTSNWRTHWIIIALSGLVVISALTLFSGRFELISSKVETLSWDQISKTNIRLAVWEEAVDLIGQNPVFGHGIGDAKHKLMQNYEINGVKQALEEELNVHNDFLEIGVKLGIIGMILLLMILVCPIFNGSTQKSIYLFFILILISHFMFESMLERYAGVGFFSFFYCFINSYLRINKRD